MFSKKKNRKLNLPKLNLTKVQTLKVNPNLQALMNCHYL